MSQQCALASKKANSILDYSTQEKPGCTGKSPA